MFAARWESRKMFIVLDADATADERARLMELTERYCVVYQTLCRGSRMSMQIEPAGKRRDR
jgi:uncharacterized OsmC-like protein